MSINNNEVKKIFGIQLPRIKDHIKIAVLNTTFSLFFNLLPFWAGILVINTFGTWTGWKVFYGNGEFYLYSCSLISSAYLIYNNNKIKYSDMSSFFSVLSLILIVITSILYASLSASNVSPRTEFIKWASAVVILFAIPLFYYSQVINNKKSPDIGEQRRSEQEMIADGLKM